MTSLFKTRDAGLAKPRSEGWLIRCARTLQALTKRRRVLSPSDLSPHLLRDIGLWDGVAEDHCLREISRP